MLIHAGNQYNQVDAEAFIKELLALIQERRLPIGGDQNGHVINFNHPKDLEVKLQQYKGSDLR